MHVNENENENGIKWILIRIENWCVRARMDADSNRKLVPIGSYRFQLILLRVRTEVNFLKSLTKSLMSDYPAYVLL